MRVIFFGTPAFAVPSLEALLATDVDVAAVVTQPDRPRGRSRSVLQPPPVKERALAAGIPVLQPERPRGDAFLAELRRLAPDLGVVVAYGHILRPELIAIPRLGLVNVHASLLPRWRGAAPIPWAILSGDRETGVAIMRIEAGLDTGGTWLVRKTPIEDTDTTGTLTTRLATLGAEALVEALPAIMEGQDPDPQPLAGVTMASKVDRDLARIHWEEPAHAVSCRVRAMDPAPGAWTTLAGSEVKLFDPGREHVDPGPGTRDPKEPPRVSGHGSRVAGTIVSAGEKLLVVCGANALLEFRTIQPAGKRRMSAADWLRGAQLPAGARFE